jgi:hypothetical protein
MITEVSRILIKFRSCFSREATFNWFVIVIMGFILRLDHHGVSSIVRWLAIRPALYTALLAYFKSTAWELKNIQKKWAEIVVSFCPVIKIGGRFLMAGDGIKISKEALKMPGVKKLHQESENSGKAPYIFGHHHGVIGLMAGWVKKNILHPPLCRDA